MGRIALDLGGTHRLNPRRWLRATDEGIAGHEQRVPQTLGTAAHGRDNNLDLMRFFAASLVVVSHSYPLAYGPIAQWEPLARLTKTATFGAVAVWIFFILSGFLVTASFERSHSWFDYLVARSLRLFPGLIVCTLLSTFVLGLALTTLGKLDYLTDRSTYSFIWWSIVYAGRQYNLPGVFDHNTYAPAINGSLWTLVYEMLYYVVVLALGLSRRLRPWSVLALVIACWYPNLWLEHSTFLMRWFASTGDLFRFFGMGMLLYLIRDRVPMSGKLAALATALLILAGWQNHPLILPDMAALVGPYLILWLAYQPYLRFARFGRFGDFSYGIYIYAFPIQQLMVHFLLPGVRAWQVFVLSYPVIVALAALSWHLVERPSLRQRRRISRSSNPRPGATATPRADVLAVHPTTERPV
jgi:peptidoglycan/LPS O-acetylase OafA/YrhL